MSGIEQIPNNTRLIGNKILSYEKTKLVTAASGGEVLGSGQVNRVIMRVPYVNCSGNVPQLKLVK